MKAKPFPRALSESEMEMLIAAWPEPPTSDGMTPRRWWMRMWRLVAVWLVVMLVCAHLALVLAHERPQGSKKGTLPSCIERCVRA